MQSLQYSQSVGLTARFYSFYCFIALLPPWVADRFLSLVSRLSTAEINTNTTVKTRICCRFQVSGMFIIAMKTRSSAMHVCPAEHTHWGVAYKSFVGVCVRTEFKALWSRSLCPRVWSNCPLLSACWEAFWVRDSTHVCLCIINPHELECWYEREAQQ